MLAGHLADATSGNRIINDTATEVVGRNGGAESTAITASNLPDHEHSLQGDNGEQYYATTAVTGGSDTGAIATSITGTAPGTSLTQTGAMIDQTGDPFQHVPPFVTVEYIIYTGVI
jgi:microcystin-dependent protein